MYSLITDGQYRATSLGRDTWKSLIVSTTVTGKGSMLLVTILLLPRQESGSLVTTKMVAPLVTLELDLALVDILIRKTHVETWLYLIQIMVINILRQWDIFRCSERKMIWANLLLELVVY